MMIATIVMAREFVAQGEFIKASLKQIGSTGRAQGKFAQVAFTLPLAFFTPTIIRPRLRNS